MAWRGFATTTVMTPSPRVHKLRRCLFRWLVPGALFALAPKCVLCLAAYFGLGAALGLTGTEICGAPDHTVVQTGSWLLAVSLVVGLIVWLRPKATASCNRRREGSAESSSPSPPAPPARPAAAVSGGGRAG